MDTFERERTTKGLRLPHGWCECPEMGAPIDDGFGPLIPCKVPLGRQWVGCVPSSVHFSPQAAVDLAFTSYNVVIGLVVDLTYSDKYYMPQEFVQLGCNYWKEPCRGRNASPDPKAVNSVCHIITQQQADPDFVFEDQVSGEKRKMGVLIHCTHGFNRTGFVVTALLHRRRLAGKLVPLGHTLQIFSQKRFPGIYKDQYVSDLFDYFHEDRPEFVRTPDLPQWKASARGVDDEDDDGGISVEQLHRDAETPRRNGIPFLPDGSPDLEEVGEDVPDELAGVIQRLVWSKVRGNELGQADDAVRFPGSQPVSLERDHVGNITADEYKVTWKADGVRYILVCFGGIRGGGDGLYLLNRNFRVRRLQVRLPVCNIEQQDFRLRDFRQHSCCILDGELVADEIRETGRHTLKYLAYDLIDVDPSGRGALSKSHWINAPFKERLQAIQDFVVRPKYLEERALATALKSRAPGILLRRTGNWVELDALGREVAEVPNFRFDKEPIRVERKDFWSLKDTPWILTKFVDQLCHECDGLIFQHVGDPYVCGTAEKMFKWKFPHLNTVDFQVRMGSECVPQLWLYEGRSTAPGGKGFRQVSGHQLQFSDGDDPAAHEGRIVECYWDPKACAWRKLRIRGDKSMPNAYSVFENVWHTIKENISFKEMLQISSDTP